MLLAAAAGNARAQGTPQAGAFVEVLVEAINGKSPDRRKTLLHPKSLVCASEKSGSFEDLATAKEVVELLAAQTR